MKLSVRSKVANGVVICLLVPRVADTAVEMFNPQDEGLDAFSADDEFILSPESEPLAVVQLQADPAGDPSACADPSGAGVLVINSPSLLTTTESNCDPSGGGIDPSGCGPFGNMELIEVSMDPPPDHLKTFYFESDDPTEAQVSPEAVVFDDLGCIPQNVWVAGQNDNFVDGDIWYEVHVIDDEDEVVRSIPGINYDNDNYDEAYISTSGPSSLPINGKGVYTVFVSNRTRSQLSRNDLVIEPTAGLAITAYAASLRSGDKLKSKGSLKDGILTFDKINLEPDDALLASIEVVLFDGGTTQQKIVARFEHPASDRRIDDDQKIRTALP